MFDRPLTSATIFSVSTIRRRVWFLALALAIVVSACSPTPPAQPVPSGGERAAAETPPRVLAAEGPVGQRRRPPANPIVQDSIRRATVDSILKRIAGREMEPAGKVFKNVLLLKDIPAGDFLRKMDVEYGRSLGWTCGNCHVTGQFDSEKKNKRIARQMQELTNALNVRELPRIKEMDKEYEQVSCAMCHRGTNEPKGAILVLPPPPSTPRPE